METNIKRPPSVWISQILHLLFAIFLAWGLVLLCLLAGDLTLIVLLVFLFYLAAIGMYVVSFWSLAKRNPYGRWLSIIALVLDFGLVLYIYFVLGISLGISEIVFLAAVGLFLVFLISRLAFGSAANAFFAKPDTTE